MASGASPAGAEPRRPFPIVGAGWRPAVNLTCNARYAEVPNCCRRVDSRFKAAKVECFGLIGLECPSCDKCPFRFLSFEVFLSAVPSEPFRDGVRRSFPLVAVIHPCRDCGHCAEWNCAGLIESPPHVSQTGRDWPVMSATRMEV